MSRYTLTKRVLRLLIIVCTMVISELDNDSMNHAGLLLSVYINVRGFFCTPNFLHEVGCQAALAWTTIGSWMKCIKGSCFLLHVWIFRLTSSWPCLDFCKFVWVTSKRSSLIVELTVYRPGWRMTSDVPVCTKREIETWQNEPLNRVCAYPRSGCFKGRIW